MPKDTGRADDPPIVPILDGHHRSCVVAMHDDGCGTLVDGDAVMRSFRGQALEGADFAGVDLRGADFTGADLRSASFRTAKLGVAPRVGAVILGLGVLVAVVAGMAIGWSVDEIRQETAAADEWDEYAAGGSLSVILLGLLGLILWKGFDVAIKAVAVVYVVVAALNIAANLIWEEVEWRSLLRATALVVFVILAIAAGLLGRVIGGVFGVWSVVLVAAFGGLAIGQSEGGIAGIAVAISSALISKRAIRGDRRDHTLIRVGHRLIRRWGTQFVDADLTGADFTGTNAMGCDARGATVTDVTWDPELPRPVDILESDS